MQGYLYARPTAAADVPFAEASWPGQSVVPLLPRQAQPEAPVRTS